MIWVRDANESLVNIARWDIIEWSHIMDKSTEECAAFKIYLQRGEEQLVLGYTSSKNELGEEIIERIAKGVEVSLNSLDSILYGYLSDRDELDEEHTDERWSEGYDKNMSNVASLIGTRFVEYEEENDGHSR